MDMANTSIKLDDKFNIKKELLYQAILLKLNEDSINNIS